MASPLYFFFGAAAGFGVVPAFGGGRGAGFEAGPEPFTCHTLAEPSNSAYVRGGLLKFTYACPVTSSSFP